MEKTEKQWGILPRRKQWGVLPRAGTMSDRSKRRTEKARKEHTVNELAYATEMSLRASGNLHASNVIRDIAQGAPPKASKY